MQVNRKAAKKNSNKEKEIGSMNREKILEYIISLIESMDTDEAVDPEASLIDDLGLESLQIYELIAELEAVLGIRIPEKVLMRVDTVEDLADEVYRLTGEK